MSRRSYNSSLQLKKCSKCGNCGYYFDAHLTSHIANARTADMIPAVSALAAFLISNARITRTADLVPAVATFLMCEAFPEK